MLNLKPSEQKSLEPGGFSGPSLAHKRRLERSILVLLILLFCILLWVEFRLNMLSDELPFINSIVFFGLLNFNIIILLALLGLVLRNLGKVFLERRRKLLGSRLKTKLILAFFGFSIIPTLVLFAVSAFYINSSFDKWFSVKIQNTLEASLEIVRTYYRNADQHAQHLAKHLAEEVQRRIELNLAVDPESQWNCVGSACVAEAAWLQSYLERQRELLALDAVEFYAKGLKPEERVLAEQTLVPEAHWFLPSLSKSLLDRGFTGESYCLKSNIPKGELLRCLHQVRWGADSGVLVVSQLLSNELRKKVAEISSVFEDYKDINPLKHPMKTVYLIILILITLVILFVAIWLGLTLAKELTGPVERLVLAAEEVGSGNLEVSLHSEGHDEIAVLVQAFNQMTADLRENRARLLQASLDLEERRLQLEAILGNLEAGVLAIDPLGRIQLCNQALARHLRLSCLPEEGQNLKSLSSDGLKPLLSLIGRLVSLVDSGALQPAERQEWEEGQGDSSKVLQAVATRTGDLGGIVLVVDDITLLKKGQRERAWREVARRIAHEIKNPLTPIQLSAQRLQRKLKSLEPKNQALLQECTETIVQQTEAMKEMVNEFSNFARFPEVSPRPWQLNEVIGEVVSLYRSAHGDVSFNLDLDGRLPIFAFDRDQIKRALINLLDNAFSAFERSSNIVRELSMSTAYKEDLRLVLMIVQDNGLGMTEEVRSRVFEPYFSTKKEGTGLGLAIVKRIVTDHDGFIRLRSKLGQGTQFLVELPTRMAQD